MLAEKDELSDDRVLVRKELMLTASVALDKVDRLSEREVALVEEMLIAEERILNKKVLLEKRGVLFTARLELDWRKVLVGDSMLPTEELLSNGKAVLGPMYGGVSAGKDMLFSAGVMLEVLVREETSGAR